MPLNGTQFFAHRKKRDELVIINCKLLIKKGH